MTRANNAPWFTKAGAASGIMPISHFVGDQYLSHSREVATDACSRSSGIDMESQTDEDLDVRVRGVEASLRGSTAGRLPLPVHPRHGRLLIFLGKT